MLNETIRLWCESGFLHFIGCITNGGNVNNETCVFPFIYKGVTYRSCTSKDENKNWCYTEVDTNANGVEGKWGYCSPECQGEQNDKK